MPNNIFSQLNGISQLMSNPRQFLLQRGLNLPPGFQGGPQEIIQHLVSTGQITQDQLNQAQQMLNRIQPRM